MALYVTKEDLRSMLHRQVPRLAKKAAAQQPGGQVSDTKTLRLRQSLREIAAENIKKIQEGRA